MSIIKDISSPCGSFKLHLHYGVNCTTQLYRPQIFKYREMPWDQHKRVIKIVFYAFKEFTESIGIADVMEYDGIFDPEYITVFSPGVWDLGTLEYLITESLKIEDYNQAAVLRDEIKCRWPNYQEPQ